MLVYLDILYIPCMGILRNFLSSSPLTTCSGGGKWIMIEIHAMSITFLNFTFSAVLLGNKPPWIQLAWLHWVCILAHLVYSQSTFTKPCSLVSLLDPLKLAICNNLHCWNKNTRQRDSWTHASARRETTCHFLLSLWKIQLILAFVAVLTQIFYRLALALMILCLTF